MVELYFGTRFLREFCAYFTADRVLLSEPCPPDELIFMKRQLALREAEEKNKTTGSVPGLVEFISASSFAHRAHCDGYLRLQEALPDLSYQDMLNLYAVLFRIRGSDVISFPACDVLGDRYPEIVLDIEKRAAARLTFRDEKDLRRYEAAVLETLAGYVLRFCPSDELAVWGADFDDGSEPRPPQQSHSFEEFEELNCYVHIADRKTVEQVKNAGYAAAYQTTDVDRGAFLIGNMITVADETLTDAVTVQITAQIPFASYEKMYRKLGTAAFGCPDRTPEDCAKETQALFAPYDPEGPLALQVNRLPRPILSKADFEALQRTLG